MPYWLSIGLMLALQALFACVCLWVARVSLRFAPHDIWMRPLKTLAALLPMGIACAAMSFSRGLMIWLLLTPAMLLSVSLLLGWAYWLVPRAEHIPIAPELNLLGSAALAGAAVEPLQGLIWHLMGRAGDGHIGNWVYVLFIPIWALFGLIPGAALALLAWMRDWRREGDSRLI